MVVAAVMERLENLRLFVPNNNLKPRDLVQSGLMDPVKLFVKDEPHNSKKFSTRTWRLIFSVSIVDNLIARLLYTNQNVEEKYRWDEIPPSPGLSLSDLGHSRICEAIGRLPDISNLEDSDMSGWDFSVQEWEFRAEHLRRLALNGAYGTDLEVISRNHMFCMARKVVILGDGSMYQQIKPGLLPSGWYITASMNSNIRALNHYHIALKAGVQPGIKTMGDDAVEVRVPNSKEEYRALGHIVKQQSSVTVDNFEFCSTRFRSRIGIPVNVDKQLYRFLSFKPADLADAEDRFVQFKYEMRHHPDLTSFIDLIDKSGWWSAFRE